MAGLAGGVRIFILTLLLAIELAVAQFSPAPCRCACFISTILFWYSLSLVLRPSAVVLAGASPAGHLRYSPILSWSAWSFTKPADGQFAEFPLSPGHYRRSVLLPRIWAGLIAALAFILYGTVLELNYYGFVPSFCSTHPGVKALQAIIFVNLFAFLAVAYLAGLLTAKLRQAGVQLKDTSGALESLQALQENIIHSISSGLITTGLDGRITLVNPAAQRLLERAASRIAGLVRHQSVSGSASFGRSRNTAHGEVRFDLSDRSSARLCACAVSALGAASAATWDTSTP